MRIAEALRDARSRTLELALDLDDAQWLGPRLPIVNPLRWELGHVAWFQERWTLRHVGGRPPRRADGDALYDSSQVAHATRWDLPLPDRHATLAYMAETLARSLEAITDDDQAYFHWLALFHEDMHDEAFTYTRQTLGYPAPSFARTSFGSTTAPGLAVTGGDGPLAGDVELEGGEFWLGATRAEPFVFDNEKWAHRVHVAPFRIARAPVTNEAFAAFVADGGYARRELWSDEGWRWRSE
ncbi:MAG: SUMF1/EgtB/PvdO family nonheme iron enzyme, partial [Kofleriaceae bacterium]